MMSEIAVVLGGSWYALLFALVVVVVAGLSNAGVLRTPVHAARPAGAWGAIFCMIPFLLLIGGILAYRIVLAETGVEYPAIMYTAILLSLAAVGFGLYLIAARRPPRAFVPRWLRAS